MRGKNLDPKNWDEDIWQFLMKLKLTNSCDSLFLVEAALNPPCEYNFLFLE